MSKKWFRKSTMSLLVIVSLVLAAGPVVTALAQEGITGGWEFKSEFNGRQMTAKVTFTKNADGKYSGTWIGKRGESTLSDISFENGKVKFTRTSKFNDQELKMTYNGTLAQDKITGTGSGERGDFPFEAVRTGAAPAPAEKAATASAKGVAVEAVLGQWDMKVTMPQREVTAKMTISRNADGTLAAKWESERGESTISDVKFDAGKLTFTRKTKFNDQEFESKFEGTVEGSQLKGTFKSDRGEMPAVGTKVGVAAAQGGGAPAAAPAPAAANVVGKWELTTTSEQGTRTRILTINKDMTGTYQTRNGETPIKDLKVDGNKVSFKIEPAGGQGSESQFSGEINGANIRGQITSERGTRDFTGRKMAD